MARTIREVAAHKHAAGRGREPPSRRTGSGCWGRGRGHGTIRSRVRENGESRCPVLLKLGTNVPAVGSSPSHNGGTGGIAGAPACTVGATGEPMIATGSGRLVAGGGAEATAAVREALAQGCSPFVRLKVWPNMASMFIPSESDRCVTACPAVTSEANRPE